MKKRLVNFDVTGFHNEARGLLAPSFEIDDVTSASALQPKHALAEVIFCRLGVSLDKKLLSFFPNVKLVATATTGLDHLDLEELQKRNVRLISLKGETVFLEQIHATPEHTWTLLLALVRNLVPACNSVMQGQWDRTLFFGDELFEKTIGIIGYGRVGKILGRYAHAFGMRVIYHDTVVQKPQDYPVFSVSMEELLTTSDVISVNVPYDTSTQHLLGENDFLMMRKNPYFLNTARGGIVDEKALLVALESKKIRGAAVDVLSDETCFQGELNDHPLVKYANQARNLIITPHIAGSTHDSMRKTGLFIAQKICDHFSFYE